MSFYGNITNSRNQFIYDRYYPNKHEMDMAANSDGVFLGRYVFVNYDLGNYAENYQIDLSNGKFDGGASNHATVWQKVWMNNQYEYILISRLGAGQEVNDLLYSRNKDIIKVKTDNIPTGADATNYLYLDNQGVYWRIKKDVDNNLSWEVILNLNSSVSEAGNNSVFELLLNLYDIQQVLQENTIVVTQEQLNKMLQYFDEEYQIEDDDDDDEDDDDEEKEGDDFVTATGSYLNGIHTLTLSVNTYDAAAPIIPIVAKFAADYKVGDTISVVLANGTNIRNGIVVYGTNGAAAVDGAWKANTIGLINVDMAEGKGYIASAIPVWSA